MHAHMLEYMHVCVHAHVHTCSLRAASIEEMHASMRTAHISLTDMLPS